MGGGSSDAVPEVDLVALGKTLESFDQWFMHNVDIETDQRAAVGNLDKVLKQGV